MKDLAYILVLLTARQHAGVSRPGMGSVAGDEWRVSYALAEDDSWYSVSADHRDYGCAGATGVQKKWGRVWHHNTVAGNGETSSVQGCAVV